MPNKSAASRLIMGLSAAGERVAECELAPDETALLPALTEEARRAGAVRLWVHCSADLSGSGLAKREGYRRFVANVCPAGEPLPLAGAETVADVWPRAFRGQWGHKRVDADMARAMASSGEAVFIGLREDGQWRALCRVEPADRLIDGPGFTGRPRTPDAVRRLVLAGCAYLGAGPVTVETWGEPAGPYLALGLEVAEDGGGWELVFPPLADPSGRLTRPIEFGFSAVTGHSSACQPALRRASLQRRKSSLVKNPYSRRTARLLTAAVASAGALVTAGALALPATAGQATAGHATAGHATAGHASAATHRSHTLTVRQIAFGKKLDHEFRPNGTGAWTREALSDPDDITLIGRHFYVTFQNNTGPQGQASPGGDLDSTLVEFTLSGGEVRQWDVAGHCDGLTADPLTRQVIATVNEDANSSMFTIAVGSGRLTHYAYNKPLPHNGGTDAISIYHGQILISASAPGTTGAPAPQPTYPAVYVVTLDKKAKVATVHPLFYDEAAAKAVNGPHAGTLVKLGLTDPDSNEVVPWSAPRFRGDFMLDSQGDQELIFDGVTGWWHQSLSVLSLPRSVDDSAWATTPFGALYTTDATADTVDTVSGWFRVGAMYSAVTPCDQSDAPATCPGPGFPPNYLASDNMTTGQLTTVPLAGPVLNPKGMIFVPFT